MASGVPGVPEVVGEDYVVKRIKALERRVDELGPSLMAATADAIGAAVAFATGYTNAGAFAIPVTPLTAATPLAECVIDVPAGYNYVGVIAAGLVAVKNTTAGPLPLYTSIEMGVPVGHGISEVTVPAGSTMAITTVTTYEEAVTGSTITLRLFAASSAPWASDGANAAILTALATFRKSA